MYCDLVRRAAVQVRPARQQLRARLVLRRKAFLRELGQPELHVVDAQLARGAVVEMLERARGALAAVGVAAHREARAAARDLDVERRLDLPQVRVQRAAQPREALVVDGVEAA